MSFKIGQKVVCINTDQHPLGKGDYGAPPVADHIEIGKVYIIRRLSNRKIPLVWLQGINRRQPHADGGFWTDSGFLAFRFRPLIERKTETGMSILREIIDRESVEDRKPIRVNVGHN